MPTEIGYAIFIGWVIAAAIMVGAFIWGNAEQIKFHGLRGVARVFCSRYAESRDTCSLPRRIFRFPRLFRGIFWRILRRFVHYGRNCSRIRYKLLKANSALSCASFLAKPR